MPKRRHEEDDIQRAVVKHYRARGAENSFMFSVPMGGYRRPREAARLKATGAQKGVPDLIFIYGGRVHCLELKSSHGRASNAQLEAIQRIRDAGGFAAVAEGLDAALRCLTAWGILRGELQ